MKSNFIVCLFPFSAMVIVIFHEIIGFELVEYMTKFQGLYVLAVNICSLSFPNINLMRSILYGGNGYLFISATVLINIIYGLALIKISSKIGVIGSILVFFIISLTNFFVLVFL